MHRKLDVKLRAVNRVEDNMLKVKKWVYILLLTASWALIYNRFLHLEASFEPGLFMSGHAKRWWIIVLAYWILDSGVLIALAYFLRRPFGLRMSPTFPFFHFGIDVTVLILLVHMAWLCTDDYLYPKLVSIGLETLWQLFIALSGIWIVLAFVRYRDLERRVNREQTDGVAGGPGF
jgi:hypothetical protein